jgi:peptidoglycan/LPS O-acetylase OafA/YrhL
VNTRYLTLDAWRGLACLLVIGYHASLTYINLSAPAEGMWASWADTIIRAASLGDVGVPLFFVISGYCIAAAADGVRRGGRSVGSYFYRRFRRIYPPFWIVVVGSVGFFIVVDVVVRPGLLSSEPWLQPRPWWYSPWQWLGNLTLTETWRWHLVGDHRAHFPGQAWTLCYEEQFYAVVGLLLAISRKRFFAGIAAVTVATLVLVALVGRHPSIQGFFFDGSWLTFAAGVLLYWTLTQATGARASAVALGVLLVGALAATRLPVIGGASGFIFGAALIPLHRWDREIFASPWSAALRYCGQMCYSLYLVHQLLVKATAQALWDAGVTSPVATLAITFPLCFAVSVVVGRTCYVFVERPFLNAQATAPAALRRVAHAS